jgi:signal peptidase I
MPRRPSPTRRSERARWSITVAACALVLGAAVVVRIQFLDVVTVSSDSMAPTVCTGDTLLVARIHAGDAVHRGDIVTFTGPATGESMIKRVVATGGEQLLITDGRVVVDGSVVPEPYVERAQVSGVFFQTVTVPDGWVFVLGDHREASVDSRSFGPIPEAAVTGRMLATLWSGC